LFFYYLDARTGEDLTAYRQSHERAPKQSQKKLFH
jgi:hypothetical protein